MKNLFLLSAIAFTLISCKKKEVLEQWPQESYQLYRNQYIKYTPYQGWAGYRLENGGSKNVAFYVFEKFDTRQCNDCGSPMIAFEFESSANTFEFKQAQDLLNANAIIGVTSSIAGPIASRLDSTTIKGQKISSNAWQITIEIEKKKDQRLVSGIFKVQ